MLNWPWTWINEAHLRSFEKGIMKKSLTKHLFLLLRKDSNAPNNLTEALWVHLWKVSLKFVTNYKCNLVIRMIMFQENQLNISKEAGIPLMKKNQIVIIYGKCCCFCTLHFGCCIAMVGLWQIKEPTYGTKENLLMIYDISYIC